MDELVAWYNRKCTLDREKYNRAYLHEMQMSNKRHSLWARRKVRVLLEEDNADECECHHEDKP
jgi:hypothetical protein